MAIRDNLKMSIRLRDFLWFAERRESKRLTGRCSLNLSQSSSWQQQKQADASSDGCSEVSNGRAQLEIQKIQAKAQSEIQVAQALHELRKEIEMIKAQATLGFKTDDQEFKEKIEVLKEDQRKR